MFITIAAGVFSDRVGLIVAASALLIVGGVVVMSGRPIVIRHGSNPFERLVRRVLPLSERYAGDAFVVRDPAGRHRATPLLRPSTPVTPCNAGSTRLRAVSRPTRCHAPARIKQFALSQAGIRRKPP